ncbi:RdRP-domain-containing protein [Lentinus tigrinus ALCF2SS1-7]|uniref:RNA-dependent RNA polymerase n=1 Tax=Lentinus tigrinus ALCF2SS1-6 TaxID=1328759 RepID=A0A5C2RTR8_9APHY|nr:RdRP-domain-containing protein [Lentinus tigrinus ALCF2SS1-6]RPD70360.1 RdRP-domain-containing protein [Lentinus tigrinus ALCF2SS1-7]
MLHKKTYWIPILRFGTATSLTKSTITFSLGASEFQEMPDCKAFRLCGQPESRFILLAIHKSMDDENLRKMLSHWMISGHTVTCAGRRYSFLGFTDTQVTSKKPKLMFLAEGQDCTVKSLLASIGDLQSVYEESGYGKYAARLHLAFSSTVPSLNIPDEFAAKIKDIEAPDGSLHTDGIGMIRDSFAAHVCNFNRIPHSTSAFQIRLGGIKGVLVRYPDDIFDNLIGEGEYGPYNIAYRPSMRKFKGGPTELELVNVSQTPRTAHLNIQLILLLITLGVPLNVFERMLEKQLVPMADIPTNRQRALQCIRRSYRPDPNDPDPEENDIANWGARLTHMLEAPQDLAEPYLRSQLLQFQKWQYRSLGKKLHLQVDKACYVMGVIDELGVLEEDEIFLKLPHRAHNGLSECVTGLVMIARMPCFSTGDVRQFKAVTPPELDHIKNCIVFSRNSPRSIPDMIASGDLDGDLYMVLWDQTLIPPTEAPALPRAPKSPNSQSQAPDMDRKYAPECIITSDAIDTFVEYRGKGSLICDLHSRWVDAAQASRALAESLLARDLAELNEKALDMVKTGIHPADIESAMNRLGIPKPEDNPKNPIAILRKKVWAEQDRVLALQYKQGIFSPPKPWRPHPSLNIEREDHQLFAMYFQEAHNAMKDYNGKLRAAIARDEHNASTREREDVKHADTLKDSFVKQYFGGTSPSERARERMRASAWYCYAYGEGKVDFAWLGARYLNGICAEKSRV